MEGLEYVITELDLKAVKGELWIDGSFLTEKSDPEDVDVVLRMSANFYDNATLEQQQAVDWLGEDLFTTHMCDSYVFFEWDESHHLFWYGEYMYSYWMRQWGFGREDGTGSPNMKGIAVVILDGNSE